MHTFSARHSLIRAFGLLLAMSIAGPSWSVDLNRRQSFEIAPQQVDSALLQFASQAKIQLISSKLQLEAHRSPGVSGEFTLAAALERLLSGTGLQYRAAGDDTIVVTPVDADARVGAAEVLRLAQGEVADPATAGKEAAGKNNAESSRSEIEEIVVTAQKRIERLQDVPISMSVVSGRELDRSNIVNVNEYLNVSVPGIATTHNSWPGTTQLSVRGVTAAGILGVGASPVAYYVDSVPFGFVRSAMVPDVNSFDVQQVEALRGPQSTLYGANAVNGVVRVLTRDADLSKVDFKTRVSGSNMDGGGGSYRGDMAVNVPLIEDKFAARAVASYADSSGWIDTLAKRDTNYTKLKDVRLKLNAAPSDALSLGLSFWRSQTDLGAFNMGGNDDVYPGVMDAPSEIRFNIAGLKVGYELSTFSVSSATSYIDYTNHNNFDLTPFASVFSFPTWYGQLGYNELDSKVFSQEINLASNTQGVWRWTAGAFYRNDKDHYFSARIYFPASRVYGDESESFAVFGELTRQFMDGKLALTGGLRYFRDEVTSLGDAPLARNIGPDTFHHVSPRAVLTWHPTTQMTAYASYGEGFRSGLNQDAIARVIAPNYQAAKPDTLHNYEVGAKGALLGGRITYDGALYYVNWKDVQQVLVVPITAFTGAGVLVNSEAASGPGVDLNVTTRPLDGLELGINMNWNDLTFDDNVLSGGQILFRKGDRLNSSPEYTFGALAAYSFPLSASGLRGRLSASYSYHAQQIVRSTASVFEGDVLRNAHVGFSIETPEHWMAELYADNVTNDRGNIATSASNTPFYNVRTAPRTIGLQFEYRLSK